MDMAEEIATYLERGAGLISFFAVLIIVVGFVLASGRYAQRFRTAAPPQNFSQFKIDLGRALPRLPRRRSGSSAGVKTPDATSRAFAVAHQIPETARRPPRAHDSHRGFVTLS
jgi:hypothetical protein